MDKNLLTGLGALTGLVSMAGMIRLIDGAGLASTFSWVFLLLAMVPWVAYAAWRARHGKLGRTGAAAVLAIDAIGLICPGLFPRIDPPWYQKLRIGLARITYRYRHFTIPLTDPELFTATPRWLEFLRTDPLSLHRATAAMLVASAQLDWFVRSAPEKITLPVLLGLAGKDRIIDNARTKTFFERFASPIKRLQVYSEAHHTLEFEPDPEPFIRDLVGWLTEVTNR